MKPRILVLGAGGFIGQRVVAALQASDWAIPIAAGHRTPLSNKCLQTVWLDAADETALMPVAASADAIVNCIAGSAATIVATARALFSVAGRIPRPPRIVHLSSMLVYGSAVGIVDETAQLRSDVGAYAAAKIEAERLATSYADVVTLRPGCVYGPRGLQWSERIADLLRARRLGDLGAAGDGYCNMVHVDDVVAAVLSALCLPGLEGQAFNLGSPAPPTWNDYFLSFAKALGAVPVSRISPRRLTLEARLWAPPLKAAELAASRLRLHGSWIPPSIPPSLLRLWTHDIRLDVAKAQAVLGVAWTPAEVGLRETAAQLRATGVA